MKTMGKILYAIAVIAGRSVLKFDRKVVKRYLGIETPLYKLWWNDRKVIMQSRLDGERYKKLACFSA